MTDPITAEELTKHADKYKQGQVLYGWQVKAKSLLRRAASALRSIPPGEGLLVRLPVMEPWDEKVLLGTLSSAHFPKVAEAIRDAIERRDDERAK